MKVKTHSLLEIVVSLHYIKLCGKKIEKKGEKKMEKTFYMKIYIILAIL